MICQNCKKELPAFDSFEPLLQCPYCNHLFRVCGESGSYHLVNINICFCPICGIEIQTSQSETISAGFINIKQSMNPVNIQNWASPVNLDFKECKEVYICSYDQFLILFSDTGEYLIIKNNEIVFHGNLLHTQKSNSRIIKLAYSNKYLVYMTKNGNVFVITVAEIFKPNINPDKIAVCETDFDLDRHNNRIAFSNDNYIQIYDLENHTYNKMNIKGQCCSIMLRDQYLFYVNQISNILTFNCHCFTDNTHSEMTITRFKHIDEFIAVSNYKYLVILQKDVQQNTLFAGSWKNVVRNKNNWESTPLSGTVMDMIINSQELVYILFNDRVMVRDITNLVSSIRNRETTMQEIIPVGLYLSMNEEHLCFNKSDISTPNPDDSFIIALSRLLNDEQIISNRIVNKISKYAWHNGHLVICYKAKNSWYLITEEADAI